MSRFILRYTGDGPKPAEDVARIRALDPSVVIEDSSPRMLLVEAPQEKLKSLVEALSGWVMSPERTYRVPDPRPRPVRAPTKPKPSNGR